MYSIGMNCKNYFTGDMVDPMSQTNTFQLSNMAPQFPNHNRGE